MSFSEPTTSVPKGSLVLITGVTSHMATHITQQFLGRGYRVRGTARDASKATWLTDDLFKAEAASGAFTLFELADMTVPGAFNEAIKGVSLVINVATPLPGPNSDPMAPETWTDPMLAMVKSLLTAAEREESVVKIVHTSSEGAANLFTPGYKKHVVADSMNEEAIEHAGGPPPRNPMFLYFAAKARVDKFLLDYLAEKKPRFGINFVLPAGVLGRPLYSGHVARGGNMHPTANLTHFYNGDSETLKSVSQYLNQIKFIDVQDVALIHVALALDPDTRGERVMAWGLYESGWNGTLRAMRKLYPQQAKRIPSDLPDQVEELTVTTDQSPALRLIKKWGGRDGFIPLEQQVKDTIDAVNAA